MQDINNIEIITKVIIGVVGAIATLGKLRELFTTAKIKQEISIDLDILEKIKNNESLYTVEIEKKIKFNLNKAYGVKNEGFINFLYGIALFVGFGFWTISLLGDLESFNAWSILTLIVAFIGLSIAFDTNEKEINENKEIPFYKIGLYEKTNFRFSLIVFAFTVTLTPVLIWKLDGFSFWQFLSGILFILSIVKLKGLIKRIN